LATEILLRRNYKGTNFTTTQIKRMQRAKILGWCQGIN